MCRGLLLGVELCRGLVVLLQSCPGFVVVSMGLVGDGLVLPFVVLSCSVLLQCL